MNPFCIYKTRSIVRTSYENIYESFFTCENSSSRHEVGTENNLSFLNHFMGTYDMFLTDLELSTDYKSVALPIEL